MEIAVTFRTVTYCSYRHTCTTSVVHSHNYEPHTTLGRLPNLDSRIVEIVIAQLVEHLYVKQETRGSTPGFGQDFSAILVTPT